MIARGELSTIERPREGTKRPRLLVWHDTVLARAQKLARDAAEARSEYLTAEEAARDLHVSTRVFHRLAKAAGILGASTPLADGPGRPKLRWSRGAVAKIGAAQ
jgi:hypothetical protein